LTHGVHALLAMGLLVSVGCTRTNETSTPQVQVHVGIFFGGQLQRRAKWPLVIDPGRQTQGFRVSLREPLAHSAQLAWEVSRPRLDQKKRVVTTRSQAKVSLPAGTQQNDQLIALDENDRPGKWKLSVWLDERPLTDSIIEVIPSAGTAADD